MEVYVSDGEIFGRKGTHFVPDENGIVYLNDNERPRRFVKEKLINFLISTGQAIRPPKIKVKSTVAVKIQKPVRPYIRTGVKRGKYNYTKKYVRTIQTPRTGDKVCAEINGITKPYISLTACANGIGISKARLSKIMRGKQENTTEYKFSYA